MNLIRVFLRSGFRRAIYYITEIEGKMEGWIPNLPTFQPNGPPVSVAEGELRQVVQR